ncbi:PHP domain-containing protein [Zongyangia hominis]|nr:phosphoesterase [Zongyangia hominis]
MTPGNIAGMAALKELDVIALTDHNSSKNCGALMKAATPYPLIVLPGMELCTSEEIHVVCLFDTLEKAMAFDAYVAAHSPDVKNRPDIFGEQRILDENDEIVGAVDQLLINASLISVMEVGPLVESFGGVAYPAHIDKSAYSLLSNLGFIPPEWRFPLFEVKDKGKLPKLREEHDYLGTINSVTSSDAHYLQDISERENSVELGNLTTQEFFTALKNGFQL